MTDLGAASFHSVAYNASGNASLADAQPGTNRRGEPPAITLRTLGRSRQAVAGDPIAVAVVLLRRGEIVAIQGPGGYQLACDATNAAAVARLRAKKRHRGKPFALMARDIAVIRRYCAVSREEERELTSARAPIVLLAARPAGLLPVEVAPHLDTLGFMLPATVLHDALLRRLHEPLVMTSGTTAGAALADIASHVLTHDQTVPGRGARSVVRVMDNEPRILRHRRGGTAMTIDLPPGFENASDILALGGEPREASCLIRNGQATFSRLDEVGQFDGGMTIAADLNRGTPPLIAGATRARHLSAKRLSGTAGVWVQHHHAHIASCLCENSYPLDGPPVLGIALDGLGWGTDGTFWGGEFLLADYRGFRRLATLRPIALPGAANVTWDPWRALYAHIAASIGWRAFNARFAETRPCAAPELQPRRTLNAMITKNINAPLASSCLVLLDAVAAALGLSTDRQCYAGDAAARLDAIADCARGADASYAFTLSNSAIRVLDPAPMWQALFTDLARRVDVATIAGRFHASLARAIAGAAVALAGTESFRVVALSGACFQNRVLFERITNHLTATGFVVLTHARVPAADSGLALGQAAIAAASLLPRRAGPVLAPVRANDTDRHKLSDPPVPPGTPPMRPDPDSPPPIEEPPSPIPVPPEAPPPPVTEPPPPIVAATSDRG